MRKYILLMSAVLLSNSLIAPAHADSREHTTKPVQKVVKKVNKAKPLTPVQIAYRASRAAGHSRAEWKCVKLIWMHESHFNPKAHNKHSGAYGIAQFMPNTWGNYKVKKTSDPKLQIKYGLRYIERRYGSPCKAWKHWKRKGWY